MRFGGSDAFLRQAALRSLDLSVHERKEDRQGIWDGLRMRTRKEGVVFFGVPGCLPC